MQDAGKIVPLNRLEIEAVTAAGDPALEPIGFWDDWIPWIDPGKNPAIDSL